MSKSVEITGSWNHLSSPGERSSQQGFSWSSGFGTLSPVNNNPLRGLASILPTSNPVKIAPIGKDVKTSSSPSFDPSSIGRLSGPEFLWGSPTYSDHQSSSWRASSVGPFASPSQHSMFLGSHHHVGSAPSSERPFLNPIVYNGVGPISHMSPHGPIFIGNGSYQGRGALNEGLIERTRTRRVDYSVNQIGNKQYLLDLDKIASGEDSRTTLMIKNIPNK